MSWVFLDGVQARLDHVYRDLSCLDSIGIEVEPQWVPGFDHYDPSNQARIGMLLVKRQEVLPVACGVETYLDLVKDSVTVSAPVGNKNVPSGSKPRIGRSRDRGALGGREPSAQLRRIVSGRANSKAVRILAAPDILLLLGLYHFAATGAGYAYPKTKDNSLRSG